MSAAEKIPEEKIELIPLHRSDFGAIQHTVQQFNATVPGNYTKAELEDPKFWANVSSKMVQGAEIRCIADDMSFLAFGLCTYVSGTDVRVRIYATHKIDKVDRKAKEADKEYEVKLRGPKKWCIRKLSTGETLQEEIPSQTEAYRWLDDYKKALES